MGLGSSPLEGAVGSRDSFGVPQPESSCHRPTPSERGLLGYRQVGAPVGYVERGGEGSEQCPPCVPDTCGLSQKLTAAVPAAGGTAGRRPGEASLRLAMSVVLILLPPHRGLTLASLSPFFSLGEVESSHTAQLCGAAIHASTRVNGIPGAVHRCGPGGLGYHSY